MPHKTSDNYVYLLYRFMEKTAFSVVYVNKYGKPAVYGAISLFLVNWGAYMTPKQPIGVPGGGSLVESSSVSC
jgi:hypothetical protein